MSTTTYRRCNLRYAGLCQDQTGLPVILDAGQNDVVSVTADTLSGTWSSAVVKLRYANSRLGPWQDFSTPISLGSGAKTSSAVGVFGSFVALDITTGEGSEVLVDFSITLSRSGIAAQAAL